MAPRPAGATKTPGTSATGSGVRLARRGLLLAIGAAALAWPHAARAQRPRRIGFVVPTAAGIRSAAFLAGLRELGYVEGQTIHVDMRFAHGRPELLPILIDQVLQLGVEVLVVGSTIGARAAKQATGTVPVVFAGSSDPVAGGIVSNLARPEANLTGFSLAYGDGFAGKWLELLRQAAPGVVHFAALWSSSNSAAQRFVQELQQAARTLHVALDAHHAAHPQELNESLAAIASSGARGLIVTPSPFAAASQDQLVGFAASRRLPAIYFAQDFVSAGGLMSYGPSITDSYRRAAAYVDKILKGAKPGDLPVEQPTRFELVLNLKAALALGLSIPQSLLLRADEVVR